MTVNELIEKLLNHPKDMEVVTDHGEGEFHPVIYPQVHLGNPCEECILQSSYPETMDEEAQAKIKKYLVIG
jgi:hypothetical protein